MSEREPAAEESNDPSAWLVAYRSAQAEEAAKWQGHELDEDGWHDEEECSVCLFLKEVQNDCRCGECCRHLIIEVSLDDAKREPKIAERGKPLYAPPELTKSGERELEGYMLNGDDIACMFLDQGTNLCTIHPTRPLVCRLFDCAGDGREQLVELGILPSDGEHHG